MQNYDKLKIYMVIISTLPGLIHIPLFTFTSLSYCIIYSEVLDSKFINVCM